MHTHIYAKFLTILRQLRQWGYTVERLATVWPNGGFIPRKSMDFPWE
jgi:hypothetical protein